MTRRSRRLVGRAHRRHAQGVTVTSTAVTGAWLTEHHPGVRASFQALADSLAATWSTIRDTFRMALRSTRADFALVPPMPPAPVRRRPGGPLIHNGRKPR